MSDNGKSARMSPLGAYGAGAGGQGSEGQKTVAIDQNLFAQTMCAMAGDVATSATLMKELNTKTASMIKTQMDQLQKTDLLLTKTDSLTESLDSLEESSNTTNTKLDAIVQAFTGMQTILASMDRNLTVMAAMGEANVKQLSHNTALIVSSNASPRKPEQTEQEWWMGLFKSADELLQYLEYLRTTERDKNIEEAK